MSAEENVRLARRIFEEAWSKGNLSVLDEVIAANYIGYDPAQPEPTHGASGFKESIQGYRAAFPDLAFTIEEAYAIGPDRVLLRWTGHGTHRGPLMGIPATGKTASVGGMTFTRFESSKAVEDHTFWDTLGLLRQLGAIPSPQPTTATENRPAAH
ncbi:MAG: ester cyclase [Ktedonobacterales bacterium]